MDKSIVLRGLERSDKKASGEVPRQEFPSDRNLIADRRKETTRHRDKPSRNVYLPLLLFALMITGLLIGSLVTVHFDLFQGNAFVPELFSGIPLPERGLLDCFTRLLCNSFLGLTTLLLLGFTLYGRFAVPIFFFIEGFLSAIRILSFLREEFWTGLLQAAVTYTVFLSLISFICILFGKTVMDFSDRLVRDRGSLSPSDFRHFFADYFTALRFTIVSAVFGLFLVYMYQSVITAGA